MAGVKGMKGPGLGGARPNSGPKKKPPRKIPPPGADLIGDVDTEDLTIGAVDVYLSPVDFLLSVMRNPLAADRIRLSAASSAAPYMHVKPSELGKKAAAEEVAKKSGAGKFAPGVAPKLAANNGKKVA